MNLTESIKQCTTNYETLDDFLKVQYPWDHNETERLESFNDDLYHGSITNMTPDNICIGTIYDMILSQSYYDEGFMYLIDYDNNELESNEADLRIDLNDYDTIGVAYLERYSDLNHIKYTNEWYLITR